MGRKLKRISGREVIRIFSLLGFESIHQRGSHIKLRRITTAGTKQTLSVPLHDELDSGTLAAIIYDRRGDSYLKMY
jgi:predicted RNA binding protein YcfA (HicA-like mRNA interferase family)